MPIDPGPHDLDRVRPLLLPDGTTLLKEVTPTFFQDLGEGLPDFRGTQLVTRFEFAEDWPTWEMHPEADEFVYLLSGATDFVVKHPGEAPVTIRVDQPGHFVMVPRGAWHTARPHAPTSMLFVTSGEGTQNEVEPPE